MRDVDATIWPDVLDLLAYWKVSPPVHLLVKAFMGIKSKRVVQNPTEAELAAAIAGFK